MKDQIGKVQESIVKTFETFESLFKEQELLAKVIEFFPYPIQIFSVDGTAILINKSALKMIGIRSVESHVGKYNVFKDPIILKLGFMDQVKQVLTGKTVYITDFNAPYQDLIHYFNVEDRDVQTISSDITCFPLLQSNDAVEFFAAVFIIKKIPKKYIKGRKK